MHKGYARSGSGRGRAPLIKVAELLARISAELELTPADPGSPAPTVSLVLAEARRSLGLSPPEGLKVFEQVQWLADELGVAGRRA